MFLQISQPWLLPQRGRRWLCTSLVCLRRGGASTRQSAYFREDFGSDTFRERKRPPTTLYKGNVSWISTDFLPLSIVELRIYFTQAALAVKLRPSHSAGRNSMSWLLSSETLSCRILRKGWRTGNMTMPRHGYQLLMHFLG